ncbi:multimeric flavodoxin WrbA [Desulfosporosinus acidiphilus SJ4]|uniref:Multimeric flavodoxin WrbA n=1 Tax=Desulfosporosinus acidiphilus (strain DSM 22704 / JCM 16185 / SJ4) TaxID=646529 RepID=I4D8L7_DESAJ|nr:NAD(P)H-dependent oxidoreductase [Desulfosporosinus acidiphilus]AFM42141.1 multimeric flavodoxin WrbA [Desulfosporosinus acidiphilus SJ4]
MKVYIVYDSESGHTEMLAKAIAEGAESVKDTQIYLKHISESQPDELADMDAIIWGCPGHFGTISANLKTSIDNLGNLWAEGKLINKIGAVFCTSATVHGGIESTLLNLIIPMLHQGMIIVGLPGNIPANALYGSYYGVGITCPVEINPDSPPNMPTESDLALGKALGQRVAETVQKFKA